MINIQEILKAIKPYVLGWIEGKSMNLATALTSADWDGDPFSTVGKTLIDLSVKFGVPAGVKAVYVWLQINDQASAGGDYWIILSPNNTAGDGISFGCPRSGNDHVGRFFAKIPCNSDGDIYYQILASGTGTMDVYLRIWSYER